MRGKGSWQSPLSAPSRERPRGRFRRFMVLFARVGLSAYTLAAAAMFCLFAWALFICPYEKIDGLDPCVPLSERLYPTGFLFVCLALGIFGLRSSFKKVRRIERTQQDGSGGDNLRLPGRGEGSF